MSQETLTSLAQIKIKLKADLKSKATEKKQRNEGSVFVVDENEDIIGPIEDEMEDLSIFGVLELPGEEEVHFTTLKVTDYFDIHMTDFVPSASVTTSSEIENFDFNVKDILKRYKRQ